MSTGRRRSSSSPAETEAEPGRVFSFETAQSGARWTYRLDPDGDATLVTESRGMFKDRPLLAKIYATLLLGGVEDHDDEMRDGMRQTLERLKAVAESH